MERVAATVPQYIAANEAWAFQVAPLKEPVKGRVAASYIGASWFVGGGASRFAGV